MRGRWWDRMVEPQGQLASQPMASPPADRPEFPAIQGRRVQLLTAPVAGGFIVQPTQLISARVNTPRQWVLTISQATRPNGVSPWQFSGEGGITYPGDAQVPLIPNVATGTTPIRVRMRWGAGGASFNTEFDYPLAGVAFGVLADSLDLNVGFFANPSATVYTTLGDVPFIGADMVEGRAADRIPLRWLEARLGLPVANQAFWTVKPYARELEVSWETGSPANSSVAWIDAAANIIRNETVPTGTHRSLHDVPHQAVAMRIIAATGFTVQPEWRIGFV